MDQVKLRSVLRPEIIVLRDKYTTVKLPELCERLGLPYPVEEKFKRQILTDAFNGLADEGLAFVAERFLEQERPAAKIRNEIQDILWADLSAVEIPKRFRREVSRSIESVELFLDGRRFDDLLDRLWILDEALNVTLGRMMGLTGEPSLRSQIDQHVHNNPGDWSTEKLFDMLGAFDAPARRFGLFIEGLASADVRPDENSQRLFVDVVNKALRPCGAEMREIGIEDGYPAFALSSTLESLGKPKNLIFASSEKPDIRFRDAVANEIEIVSNADKVLVYDRLIPSGGLTWNELQAWWCEIRQIPDNDEAARSLYARLRSSLPENSPPQRLLFREFFSYFKSCFPELPALLPEVWLYWDPKTVRERGPQALLRFRMDFLMLLPHGVRVVIEVDGRHHYAKKDGKADPILYAEMVAGDRELALSGYYVFRFGAAELLEGDGGKAIGEFFDSLFKRFKVPVPRNRPDTRQIDGDRD